METQKRAVCFIDGSNLYFKLKAPPLRLTKTLAYDYGGLCRYVSRSRQLMPPRYYVGAVRAGKNNPRAQKLWESQRQLFVHLRSKSQDFVLRHGFMLENNGVYKEKGVDVLLATDMLIGAYEDLYDVAIVISSDTDLIPAISKVKQLGKRVEYVGFEHQPSKAMMHHCSVYRLLKRDEVLKFSA